MNWPQQLQELIEIFGTRFIGLIDDLNVYGKYKVPHGGPYPQDYIIDQNGIVRYWAAEHDPQHIIKTIDQLLDTQVKEQRIESHSPFGLVLNITPNPFKQCVNITFQALTNKKANLKIFDVSGRLVRSLSINFRDSENPRSSRSGKLTNEPISQISWLGDDDFGHKVPAGVYFIRLESNEKTVTKSVILCK